MFDAVAAAAGINPSDLRSGAGILSAAGLWPDDGEQVEPKHAAALLVAILATPAPEVVREVGSLPFSEVVWSNTLGSTQSSKILQPENWFTEHATFGHVLTCAVEDYRSGEDPWLGKICARKISAGFTADEWFAELEAEVHLGRDLQARGTYCFRRSQVAPAEAGKLVWRTELPADILRDFAAALDGQMARSVASVDRPAVLLH